MPFIIKVILMSTISVALILFAVLTFMSSIGASPAVLYFVGAIIAVVVLFLIFKNTRTPS